MSSDFRTHNQKDAREWVPVLAKYRQPDALRSSFELGVSVIPFIALWAMALWIANFSYIAAFGVALLNGAFLLRMFCIQHDCGHGSFFDNRTLSDWVGRVLGVFTFTPYDVWRRTHSIHHSHAGDLDHRGIGDVMTLTVEEYNARTKMGRLKYRMYRHPLVMFGLGPSYLFMLQNRLPLGLMNQGKKYWISAMGTNAAMALIGFLIVFFGGWQACFCYASNGFTRGVGWCLAVLCAAPI
jgi:omega-6 fatty acid desaturase (delta-12 desaturase)